jgi:hypothetical protein
MASSCENKIIHTPSGCFFSTSNGKIQNLNRNWAKIDKISSKFLANKSRHKTINARHCMVKLGNFGIFSFTDVAIQA